MGDMPPLTRSTLRNVPIVEKLVVNTQHKQRIGKNKKCPKVTQSAN